MMPKKYCQTMCPLCKRVVSKDTYLPCEHNYCRDCLTSAVRLTQRFECPECKRKFDSAAVGLESLTLTDPPSTGRYCTVQGHKNNPLDVFCRSHQTVLCGKCALKSHKMCDTCEIEEISVELKHQVQEALEQADDLYIYLDHSENKTKLILKEAQEKLDSLERSVLPLYREQKEAVEDVRNQARQLLHEQDVSTLAQVKVTLDTQLRHLLAKPVTTVHCDIRATQSTLSTESKILPAHKSQQKSERAPKESAKSGAKKQGAPRIVEDSSSTGEVSIESSRDGSFVLLRNVHYHPGMHFQSSLSGYRVVQKREERREILAEYQLTAEFMSSSDDFVELCVGNGWNEKSGWDGTLGSCYTQIPSWLTTDNVFTLLLDRSGKEVARHTKKTVYE